MRKKIANDTTSPFGTYAPNAFQSVLLGITRAMPTWEPTYRIALALQKPLLAFSDRPIDISTYGCNIRFHPFDNVSERRALTTPERFDPNERAFLESALFPGATFIDIGANAGLYSMAMAPIVGETGTVLSIEPQARVFERLTFNAQANNFSQIRPRQLGISDQEGELSLYENPDNCGEATMAISSKMDGHETKVPVKPLLTLLDEEQIQAVHALKIDIEGHEDVALMPFFERASAERLPKIVVTENSRQYWQKDWLSVAINRGYAIHWEDRRNIVLLRNVAD